MPIEVLAARGEMTLAFGPMKPVGLNDPRTGSRHFAVLQLRPENRERTAFNLVGFQTRMTIPAQREVFRRMPGLEKAEFLRFGSVHRNTFLNAPRLLDEHLRLRTLPRVSFAGQLAGVEGYVESAACGLIVGMYLAAELNGTTLPPPPKETALGGLLSYLREPQKDFQPSNVNFSMVPKVPKPINRRDRKPYYVERARKAFQGWLEDSVVRNDNCHRPGG